MKFQELTEKPRPDDGSEPIIKAFVKFASQKLGLKEPPNIKLHRNPKLASQRRSFGGYMPGQGIEINIGNRHIMDVLRTLAHEMVHYKQDINGQLKPDSGRDGSDEENEANAKAAVVMRLWAKMNPELFQHATILAESQKRKLKEFNLPWSTPAAQPAPAATSAFPQQQPMAPTPAPAVPKPQAAAPKPAAPPAPPAPPAFEPADHKETLIKVAKKNGIKKPNDLASLLGQVAHETMNWTKSVENLKYTDANRIYRLFTSSIPNEKAAAPYVNNPIALANVAYAGKNGNGDARSGDGWKYRGRGFLQVTGRANYQMVGQLAHPENPTIYVDNPDLLSTNPVESARAAVAYFIKRVGLGKSIKYATKQINPAGVGAKSRVAAVKQAKRAMTERLDKTTIHKLADKKGIKWDDEPAFLKLTKQVTGHRYLDDLDQDGLFKMKNYLDRLDERHDQVNKLVIFDIDDTLVHTNTRVKVVRDNRVVKQLNSHEFTHYKLGPGEQFDFGAFRNAREFFDNAKPIVPMIQQLRDDIATGNKVVMITARADFDDRDTFLNTFKQWQVDMDKVHVYRAGNDTRSIAIDEKKAAIIRNLMDQNNFNKVIMYDDSIPNLDSFVNLKKVYPHTKFYAWHVDHDGETSEYQRTDENFADGRNPQDKGDSARHGIPKKASLSSLDKITHSNASPRKKQLAHWQANMRRGRNKND